MFISTCVCYQYPLIPTQSVKTDKTMYKNYSFLWCVCTLQQMMMDKQHV